MISVGGLVEKRFNEYTLNSRYINEEVLFKILNKNSTSKYGKKYDFNSIKSVDKFKSNVPITDYLDYEIYK